ALAALLRSNLRRLAAPLDAGSPSRPGIGWYLTVLYHRQYHLFAFTDYWLLFSCHSSGGTWWTPADQLPLLPVPYRAPCVPASGIIRNPKSGEPSLSACRLPA